MFTIITRLCLQPGILYTYISNKPKQLHWSGDRRCYARCSSYSITLISNESHVTFVITSDHWSTNFDVTDMSRTSCAINGHDQGCNSLSIVCVCSFVIMSKWHRDVITSDMISMLSQRYGSTGFSYGITLALYVGIWDFSYLPNDYDDVLWAIKWLDSCRCNNNNNEMARRRDRKWYDASGNNRCLKCSGSRCFWISCHSWIFFRFILVIYDCNSASFKNDWKEQVFEPERVLLLSLYESFTNDEVVW